MESRRNATQSGRGYSMPRPKLNPTEEQRLLVKSFAAVGISHEAIAKQIGIRSPKTLRKHFRKELDGGSTEANYKVGQTLFQMATSGQCPAATIFWAKTRNHFHEQASPERPPMPPPPFVVAQDTGVRA
jgi:hypothetical protein